MNPELERTPMPDGNMSEVKPITDEEIERWEQAAKEATRSPWDAIESERYGGFFVASWRNRAIWDDRGIASREDALHIANMQPANITRVLSELRALRKSSHSVSQCCPMSERLETRVEELEKAATKFVAAAKEYTKDKSHDCEDAYNSAFDDLDSALSQACTREAAAEASAKGVKDAN